MHWLRGVALAGLGAWLLAGCGAGEPKHQEGGATQLPAAEGAPELGEVVRWFLLERDGGVAAWSMMGGPDSPIRWETDGVAEDRDGAYRLGRMDILVEGVGTQVLRQVVERLPWTVRLGNGSIRKFGPAWVEIEPDSACFGQPGLCAFEVEGTLRRGGVSYRKVCEQRVGGSMERLYRVGASGRQQAWLWHATSAGSGGQSSQVALHYRLETLAPGRMWEPNEACLGAAREIEAGGSR